jgi:hypothetical protein
MKILDLLSPPFAPLARGHSLAPFPVAYKLLEPVERSIVVDAVTAASFAIERLDLLDGVALFELLGHAAMPDGSPARALRIGLRRLSGGDYARVARPFHAHLVLEPDTGTLAKDLRGICDDGFREARDKAAHLNSPKLFSTPAGRDLPPDIELLFGPNGAKPSA